MMETDQTELLHPIELIGAIDDDLRLIRQLLNKPDVCVSAPEIIGVVRVAVSHVLGRHEELRKEIARLCNIKSAAARAAVCMPPYSMQWDEVIDAIRDALEAKP